MIGKAKYANVGQLIVDAARIRERLLTASSAPSSDALTEKASASEFKPRPKTSKRAVVDGKTSKNNGDF